MLSIQKNSLRFSKSRCLLATGRRWQSNSFGPYERQFGAPAQALLVFLLPNRFAFSFFCRPLASYPGAKSNALALGTGQAKTPPLQSQLFPIFPIQLQMQRLSSYKVLTTTKWSRTPAPSSPRGTCLMMCTWAAPLGKIPSRTQAQGFLL